MRTLLIEAIQFHQLERTLRDRGHEVVRCDGAESAHAQLVGPPFDMVIVDLGLAGVDFQDFSRSIRSVPGGDWCQILVISASEKRTDVEQAIRSGADDYLVPSAERISLQTAAHQILEQVLRWTANEPQDDVSVLGLGVE